MHTVEEPKRRTSSGMSLTADRRVAEMRRAAARHRERAEKLYALARDCRTHADQVMFEEFGRRELEAYGRLERCAERCVRSSTGASIG